MTVSLFKNWLPPALSFTAKQQPAFRSFFFYAIRLVLVAGLLRFYNVESGSGLSLLIPFIAGGALLHFFLPMHWRPTLLIGVCITCIIYAIGWVSGSFLCGAVLLLLVCAHLPVSYRLRLLLLLLITAGFTALRLQFIHAPRLLIITPLIGTLLMFRFMLYMHELKHEKNAPSWSERLSYLFNPVNIGLPLFPVIDYKTWLRGRTPVSFDVVYNLAFRRIVFGTCCLLLYRLVYLQIPPISEIQSAENLIVYIFFGYTLILRMLGILWIAIGLVGLYGYELPPVFDQVFLAERISEIWRRVNIYWRDFITKVIYYPAYFRLRKKSKYAVLFSTFLAFVGTWFLHNWQWFWIRGDFHFNAPDFAYWMILGVLIAISVSRASNAAPHQKKNNSIRESFFYMLRISGMFMLMSVLWTLWNSSSISDWFFLLSKITAYPLTLIRPLLYIALFIVLGTAVHRLFMITGAEKPLYYIKHPVTVFSAGLLLLLLALLQPFYKTNTVLFSTVNDMRFQKLNQQDRENAEQGYYENLVDAGNGTPWEQSVNTRGRGQWFSGSEVAAPDIRKRTLKPNFQVKSGNKTFTTNRWGMRSPECDTVKPDSVYRIAFIGSSYEMGSGVSDEEVFARVFEKEANAWLKAQGKTKRVEVLNFSVGGYSWPQFVWLCDNRVYDFHPDRIFVFSHTEEKQRIVGVMARLIQNGLDLEYEELKNIKNVSGAQQSMSRTTIQNLLYPYEHNLLEFGYRKVSSSASKTHTKISWVYVPAVNRPAPAGEYKYLFTLAERHHFDCMTLQGAYAGTDESKLQLTTTDNHPNAKGHELLGKKLVTEFLSELGELR